MNRSGFGLCTLCVILCSSLSLLAEVRIRHVRAEDLGSGRVQFTVQYALSGRSCTGRGTPAVSLTAEGGDRGIVVDGGKRCGLNTVTIQRRALVGAALSVGVWAAGGADTWDGTVRFANGLAASGSEPTLYLENADARVYAFRTSIRGAKRESESIAGWVLETIGTGTITGFDPVTAAVSLVLGRVVSMLEEQLDPVLVVPVMGDRHGAVAEAARGRFRLSFQEHDTFSAAVILDFIRVREHGGSGDVARYDSGLDLHLLRSGSLRNRRVETRRLLSKHELRQLDPANSYVVIPKVPFHVRGMLDRSQGSILFELSAGARYGLYGRPGTIHDHTVLIELHLGLEEVTVEQDSADPRAISRTRLNEIKQALERFKEDCGSYPSTSEWLLPLYGRNGMHTNCSKPPYIERATNPAKDGWGNLFRYLSPSLPHGFAVFSLGADGKPGGTGTNADLYVYGVR